MVTVAGGCGSHVVVVGWVAAARGGQDDLRDGEDIATCPSCSLRLRVIYDEVRPREFGRWLLGVGRWVLGMRCCVRAMVSWRVWAHPIPAAA